MPCCCLHSDPKMRLGTWENTVLIYSTVIHAGHQTDVKSCWRALRLGNDIGSRAKPAVLFLRLRALFQNYCLLFSSSLVVKRSPLSTKNYHDLGVNKSFFFKVIDHEVPHESIYFMLPWSLSSSFFFFHIPKYFILLSPWNLEDLGFSLSQDSYRWPMHQTTSSHELQPQNKYTTYQTKGALFKSPFFLAASSSHTIIPRANYKSFALDSTHYLKCIKLATTTILVKWSTARKGLCCRCNIFHRDSFT